MVGRYWQACCWTVLAAITFVLGVQVLGLPSLAIVGGTWLLAAALHYAAPSISGPAAWAGGVIAEVSLLGAGSLALSILSHHRHGVAVNFAVLLVPVVIGALGVAIAVRRAISRPAPRRRGRLHLALVVHFVVLAVASWVASDRAHGLAWAMSGDARNHALIMRRILGAGGLSLSELRTYPALVDAVAALISGASHRVGLAPGALMLHDAAAMAATYVLTALAIGCVLVATLAELLPPVLAVRRRLPLGAVVVMLGCAATAGTPLVLGTSVQDGFLSAYGSLPFAMAAVVLGVRFCAQPGPVTLVLLGPAGILTFFGWTLLAVVPIAIAVVALGVLVVERKSLPSVRRSWLAAAVTIICLLAMLDVSITHLAQLRKTFVTVGSITSPNVKIVDLFLLLLIGLVCAAPNRVRRTQLLAPAVAALAGIFTARWVQSIGSSPVPTYYSAKTLYLVASCLVWVPFALVLQIVFREAEPATVVISRRRSAGMLVSSLAWTLATFLLIGFATVLTSPVAKARDGWLQPDAPTVAEMAKVADRGRPFIFWQWTDTGNERLGDFWAIATWDTTSSGADLSIGTSPALPGGVLYWAYVEVGATADLCSIATAIPGLVVVTANNKLAKTLKAACPRAKPQILLEPTPR